MPRCPRRFATRSSRKLAEPSIVLISTRLPAGDVIMDVVGGKRSFEAKRFFNGETSMPGVAQLIATGILLVAAGYVIRGLAFGTSADFIVNFDGTSINVTGKFPAWLEADLSRLLREEMKLGPTRIRGTWQRDRYLKVDVDQATPNGDAQRIRNFLKTQLNG